MKAGWHLEASARRARSWTLSVERSSEGTRTAQSERVHSRLFEEVGHFAPGIEHTGLHGRCGHADDLRDFLDRFLVVVYEVDDFAVCGRQLPQALLHDGAAILVVDHSLRIVGSVLDIRGH